MKFLNLVKSRQSERGYLDTPVDIKKIERCIEAARFAPSACNSQPWKFIVITDKEIKDKLAKTTSSKMIPLNHFTSQAPVFIVVVSEKQNLSAKMGQLIKSKDFDMIDLGIATEHICLQAKEEDLGTCILGWFDEKKVKKLLKIPRSKRPILIITLGYPSITNIRPKIRKELKEIMNYNEY